MALQTRTPPSAACNLNPNWSRRGSGVLTGARYYISIPIDSCRSGAVALQTRTPPPAACNLNPNWSRRGSALEAHAAFGLRLPPAACHLNPDLEEPEDPLFRRAAAFGGRKKQSGGLLVGPKIGQNVVFCYNSSTSSISDLRTLSHGRTPLKTPREFIRTREIRKYFFCKFSFFWRLAVFPIEHQ